MLLVEVADNLAENLILSFLNLGDGFLLLLDVLPVLRVDSLDSGDFGFDHFLFILQVHLAL